MPRWIVEKKWKDQEVFIIGGGESLKGFDWGLLKPLRTIGCNDAYVHGTDICLFGDTKWFEHHEKWLRNYEGIVFTSCPKLQKSRVPWLWLICREAIGLHKGSIGWNFSTGANAINLALLLGAAKIYLLGFDVKLSKYGKSNWHDNNLDAPNEEVYPKFLEGFKYVARDLRKKFPEVKVINVTNDSALNEFPKISTKEFWKGRS